MEWVNVEERLPTVVPNVYLISYNPARQPGMSCVRMAYRFTMFRDSPNAYDCWCEYPGADDIDETCVTYWADIPAPPDSKEAMDESPGKVVEPA